MHINITSLQPAEAWYRNKKQHNIRWSLPSFSTPAPNAESTKAVTTLLVVMNNTANAVATSVHEASCSHQENYAESYSPSHCCHDPH